MSKKFLSPTLSRKFILKKYILKAADPLSEKQVIEFGCGNGFWLRLFCDAGSQCTGVDRSQKQIDLARSFDKRNITYFLCDVSDFRTKSRFDLVYIDHVLSETSSPKTVVRILNNARAILKKNGRLVLNEMHPSVAHFPFKDIDTRPGYFYFKSGAPLSFGVRQANGGNIAIRDYHWTMQDLSLFLKKSGFIIEEILEPRAHKNSLHPYLKLRYKFPSHMVIKASLK